MARQDSVKFSVDFDKVPPEVSVEIHCHATDCRCPNAGGQTLVAKEGLEQALGAFVVEVREMVNNWQVQGELVPVPAEPPEVMQ